MLSSGVTALAAGLGGCATDPPGTAAAVRGGGPGVPDAPVVARTSQRSPDDDGCPQGVLRASGRVHETRRGNGPNDLVLLTEFDVVTGESGCASGWGQAGIEATHDYGDGDLAGDVVVTDSDSNVVPVAEDRGHQATLEARHDADTGRWTVHLTPPTRSTMTYRFRSQLTGAAPSEGDRIAQVRGEARVRKGWLGGNGTLGTSAVLVYGEDGT